MNIPDFEEFSDISGELKDVYTKLKNELAEARRERDVLKLSLERASRWSVSDESLPEDVDIVAAFPLGRTDPGRFEVYAEAQRLVSAKRSKAALVDLVNWLLVREAEARLNDERYRWLRAAHPDVVAINWNIGHDWIDLRFEQLDAALDAARGES